MADKIRGITIEIGGDTTGLSKALKDVNSDISGTQKQLKDVERLLKLDPSNVELLEQKQRLLTKSTEEYRTKLQSLKGAQEQFADAAASGDEKAIASYEALQREIVSVSDHLKTAEEEAAKFDAGLAEASASLDAFSSKAGKVAESTKAISAAGAAVVGGLTTMAVKAASTADDLLTLSQQSGFTVEELQKFQYASDLVDVSFDTINGATRRLKKNLTSTSADVQAAWNTIGVSVKGADGQFRDINDIFYDTLEGLSRIRNETERDTVAMTLFGKSADELAGIVDDGGAKLKALGDEAERLGLIVEQDDLEQVNELRDRLDSLKATMQADFLKAGIAAFEAFDPVLTTVMQAITGLLNALGEMDSGLIAVIGSVAALLALVSPVAGILKNISSGLSNIITLIPAITAAAPWVALIALIGVLVTAIVQIVKRWDEVKAAMDRLIDSLTEKWENFKGFFVNLWDVLRDRAVENINTIIGWVNAGIEAINALIMKLNDSALGKALNLDIGTIGTIQPVGGGNTTVTNNTYNQLSTNPIQANFNVDGMTMARQMVGPLDYLHELKGNNSVK